MNEPEKPVAPTVRRWPTIELTFVEIRAPRRESIVLQTSVPAAAIPSPTAGEAA